MTDTNIYYEFPEKTDTYIYHKFTERCQHEALEAGYL